MKKILFGALVTVPAVFVVCVLCIWFFFFGGVGEACQMISRGFDRAMDTVINRHDKFQIKLGIK